MNLVAGALLIAVGLFGMSAGGSGFMLPTGAIFLVVALIGANRPLVEIRDEHLEIRRAPLASLQLVRFTDIQSVDSDGKRPTLHLRTGEAIALPRQLDAAQSAELMTWLDAKVSAE